MNPRSVKGSTELIIAIALISVLSLGSGIIAKNEKKKEIARCSDLLVMVLNATNNTLDIWTNTRKEHVQRIAQSDEMLRYTKDLLNLPRDSKALCDSQAQKEARKYFDPILESYEDLGMFIIAPDRISIASMRDENIASLNLVAEQKPNELNRVFDGEVRLITPIKSDVAIRTDVQQESTMFIASPIRDEENQVIAVLALRIDPFKTLTSIMALGRVGESGEAYAFDERGVLVTESRFNDDLIALGFLKANEESSLNIKLVDPITGEQTRLLQDAKKGVNEVRTTGYHDYRGRMVYGVSLWNEATGLGIASEIDEEEALEHYAMFRQSTLVNLGLVSVLVILLALIWRYTRIKREQAQKQLQAKTESLENNIERFVEMAPVGIATNNMDGTFIEINEAFERFIGYSISELREMSQHELTPPEFWDEDKIQKSRLHNEGKYGPYEKELICKDGRRFSALLSGVKIVETSGKETIWSIVQDISYQKEVERRIGLSNQQMKQAKLEAEAASKAKSTFLANMSHEIRTPMHSILGHTQILEQDESFTPLQMRSFQAIQQSGEHLLKLINDILDLSKVESGKFTISEQDFSLNKMFSELRDIFQISALEKGLYLNFHVEEDVPDTIVADPHRVRQVVINLLNNAIKFTKRGGINVRVKNNLELIKIEVSDTGVGITLDESEKIFETFSQGRIQDQDGTGLGLSISKDLAILMGGDVRVSSVVGEGSCFTFSFVYAKSKGRVHADASCAPHRVVGLKAGSPRVSVLVADDMESNVLVARAILEPLGFEVIIAVDGEDAIQKTTAHHPDIVLMDIQMPGLNGLDASRIIRDTHATQNIPIVALTASVLNAEKDHFFEHGIDGYLSKPYRIDELLQVIQSHCDVQYEFESE